MRKNILWILTAVICLSSCQYDDSDLRAAIKDHQNRLVHIEKTCQRLNSNISSIREILEAVQEKDYVTAINSIEEGGSVIGYTLVFKESGPQTIYVKNDGKDGLDAPAPNISIKKDPVDERWYWSLDGRWLLDKTGSRLSATPTDGIDGNNGTNGQDGKEGLPPLMRIDKDGYWYYKTDGDWIRYTPATGADGKPGQDAGAAQQGETGDIGEAGPEGQQGPEGDSFFKDVVVSENSIRLIFPDGNEIEIPLAKNEFVFSIDQKKGITIIPGGTAELRFKMSNVHEGAMVKVLEPEGWKAVVSEDAPVSGIITGTITVTAPDPLTDEKLTVLAFDGESVTLMTLIDFIDGKITTTDEIIRLKGFEEDFEIPYMTNLPYDCKIVIPAGTDWLSLSATTKGMTEKRARLHCSFNIGTSRTATVEIQSIDGKIKKTVGIEQASLNDIVLPAPAANEINYLSYDRKAIDLFRNEITNEYSGDYGRVTLPETGFDMSDLFSDKDKLIGIAFPEGIEGIGTEACSNCRNLIFVRLPESLKTVGYRSFYDCVALKDLTLPSQVENFESNWICNAPITSITYPASTKMLGYPQLTGCNRLETINVLATVPPTSEDGTSPFYDCDKNLKKIYVPVGSLEAYKNSPVWEFDDNLFEEKIF